MVGMDSKTPVRSFLEDLPKKTNDPPASRQTYTIWGMQRAMNGRRPPAPRDCSHGVREPLGCLEGELSRHRDNPLYSHHEAVLGLSEQAIGWSQDRQEAEERKRATQAKPGRRWGGVKVPPIRRDLEANPATRLRSALGRAAPASNRPNFAPGLATAGASPPGIGQGAAEKPASPGRLWRFGRKRRTRLA